MYKKAAELKKKQSLLLQFSKESNHSEFDRELATAFTSSGISLEKINHQAMKNL
jgi:hypothetical protein